MAPAATATELLVGFYKRGRAEGDFDNGIRVALERLLVSPDFLFRIHVEPPNVKGWPGGRAWINAATLCVRYNTCVALAGGNVEGLVSELRASLGAGAPTRGALVAPVDAGRPLARASCPGH